MQLFKLFGSILIDDKEANASLTKTEKKTTTLANKMGKMGESVGNAGKKMSMFATGPIVAAGAGILALASKTANAADRILDLADITGMTTDAIQEWQHVANLAGVSTEAMTNASQKLTKQMSTMSEGTGKSAEALANLGITFGELEEASPDQRMMMLIEALEEIDDPARRAQLGTDLLGGSWKELAPIVSMGTAAIDKATNAAHEMGAVMSEDALNDANEFRIGMENLKTEFGAVFTQLATQMMPLLNDVLIPLIKDKIIPIITEWTSKITKVVEWFTSLDDKTQKVILSIIGIVAAIGPALIIISKLIAIAKTLTVVIGVLAGVSGIGLIIVAITALIAIGVLLWKNWDTVKEKATSIFNSIVQTITRSVDRIRQSIQGVLDFFNRVKNTVSSGVDSAKNTVSNAFGRVKSFIPGLAVGGTTTSAGRVLVGERGPEFLDLPKGATVTPLEKAGISITINNPHIFDQRDADKLGDMLVKRIRTLGVAR